MLEDGLITLDQKRRRSDLKDANGPKDIVMAPVSDALFGSKNVLMAGSGSQARPSQ